MTLGFSFLRVTQLAGGYLLVSIIKTGSVIGAALVLLSWASPEVEMFLWAEVSSVTLVGIVALVFLRDELRFAPSREAIARVMAPSFPLLLTAIAGWAVAWSDRLLLARFVPLAQIAEDEFGIRVALAFTFVGGAPFSLDWHRRL